MWITASSFFPIWRSTGETYVVEVAASTPGPYLELKRRNAADRWAEGGA